MNRVIKFRGKRIDNGEWVYGDLYHYEKFAQICVHYDDETDDLFQVVPETVGQFTGHKDYYGKDVYEGDILETNKGLVALVTFDKADVFMLGDEHPDSMFSFSKMEIIGNIYDNPELLKGGAQ